MRTPASLWRPSPRTYDPVPAAWDYGQGTELRKVDAQGHIYVANQPWHVSRALASHTVALERIDDRVLVFFCQTLLREIDLCAQRSTLVERWAQIPKM